MPCSSLDELDDLEVLGLDLLALEAGQAAEAHVEDGVGLDLGEPERASCRPARAVVRCRCDARMSAMTSSRWSSAILRPSRMWARSSALASSNSVRRRTTILAVRRCTAASSSLSVQRLRPAVDQRQHDDAEGGLQLRVLVELVQDDLRLRVALELDDDAHAVAVGLVAQVGDARRACRSFTSSAIFSSRFALLTWYGISVTMSAMRAVAALLDARPCARTRDAGRGRSS